MTAPSRARSVDSCSGVGSAREKSVCCTTRPGVGSITIGFRSSEPIRQTVQTLKARGVVFRGDIVDDTQVFIANFEDPDGNPLYLAEPKAGYARSA